MGCRIECDDGACLNSLHSDMSRHPSSILSPLHCVCQKVEHYKSQCYYYYNLVSYKSLKKRRSIYIYLRLVSVLLVVSEGAFSQWGMRAPSCGRFLSSHSVLSIGSHMLDSTDSKLFLNYYRLR